MRHTQQTQKRIRIGVIFPSRGTTYSKTVEEMLTALDGYDYQIFFSHGLPIPDCFEIPTQKILRGDFTHLLIFEDDMIIPPTCIGDMLATNEQVVAYDYPITKEASGTVLYDTVDKAFFTGCGILLIDINILKRLKSPIWTADMIWNIKNHIDHIEFIYQKAPKDAYGLQDIAFGLRLYYNKMPIHVMPTTVGQRKMSNYGPYQSNNGAHTIDEWVDTEKQIPTYGVEEKFFRTVTLLDGTSITLNKATTEKLILEGKATSNLINNAEFSNIEAIREWLTLID